MARAGDVVENPAGRMRLRFLRTAADTNGELVEMPVVQAVVFPALAMLARLFGQRP